MRNETELFFFCETLEMAIQNFCFSLFLSKENKLHVIDEKSTVLYI